MKHYLVGNMADAEGLVVILEGQRDDDNDNNDERQEREERESI